METMTAPTMPCSTPSADDDDCCAGGDQELVQADAKDAAHPFQVDQLDADEEYHRGEDGVGQVLEGTGEKQQDQRAR